MLSSICMQFDLSLPESSNMASHVNTAVSPIELPVKVTSPLSGLQEVGHVAEKFKHFN